MMNNNLSNIIFGCKKRERGGMVDGTTEEREKEVGKGKAEKREMHGKLASILTLSPHSIHLQTTYPGF
jgi:hypothetical protein